MRLFSLILFALSIPMVIFAGGSSIQAAQSDITIGDLDDLNTIESPEDRQVKLLREKAIKHYERSLSSLDEADILLSIEVLDELIERYPDSAGARDAYFWMADLLAKKLQTEDGYKGAIKAYEDYLTRFSWHERAWEAQYSIAAIQYLYQKDYKAAEESINKLFEDFAEHLNMNLDNLKAAKILYANIMHKNGELGEEIKALDEVEVIDYKIDYEYRALLNKGIKSNRILQQGPEGRKDKYIFMGEFDPAFPVSTLLRNFERAEKNVQERLPGLERRFPLEIFVYQDPEYFTTTTDRTGSFGSGADAQIYYLDGQPIEPLFGQVYSFIINNQPSNLRVNFLEVGFINAFGDIGIDLDTAALELGISEENFTGEILLDNGEFPFLSENASIAAAFVDHLLSDYPPEYFYRAFRMLEGSRKLELKIAGPMGASFRVDDNRVNPETLLEGFHNVYGVDFDTVAKNFLMDMKFRRDELDRNLDLYLVQNPSSNFKRTQDAPEDTLRSYFTAIKLGRYDDFRKCTTGILREQLDTAYDVYKDRKILDKVERWKMIIPYRDVNIDVFNRQAISSKHVVFGVNLLKNGKIMEKRNLVLIMEDGKWYVAEN